MSIIELDPNENFIPNFKSLCDGTKDKIASINIPSKHKIHLGFDDPRKAYCSEGQIIDLYRDIHDEIRNELDYFYSHILINESAN